MSNFKMSVTTVVTVMMLTLNVLRVSSEEGNDKLWTLDSEGQCYIRRKTGIALFSCEAGKALTSGLADTDSLVALNLAAQQSAINDLKDTVSELTGVVNAQQSAISSLTDVVNSQQSNPGSDTKAANRVEASISLTPNRKGGSQNCYDVTHGPCGVDLSVDGVEGLICFPNQMPFEERKTLAQAVLAAIGEPTTTLLFIYSELGITPPGTGHLFDSDYFNDPTGMPGYWNLNDCVGVNSQNLQDYADCAKTTTFDACSKSFEQRYFMIGTVPAP